MQRTPLEEKLEIIARPIAEDLGLDLLCISVTGSDSITVQVLAEDPKTRNLGLQECTKLSRALSAIFDVEDPITGAYRLEVSSPGIDRPLLRFQDFDTYKGLDTKIEMRIPTGENGQKRFRGIIEDTKEDNVVCLQTDQGLVELDFQDIKKAKLVMSDDLIKKMSNRK